MNYDTSYYSQSPTGRDREQNLPLIPEDEKITVRISPFRPKEGGSTARAVRPFSLHNSALRLERVDARQTARPEAVSEIDLGSLEAADQIVIETAHSLYTFTVTDPLAPSGRLAGGILGDQTVDAYLLSSHADNGASELAHKRLKAGLRSIFVIEAEKGPQKLTTSAVKSLLHRKKQEPQRH